MAVRDLVVIGTSAGGVRALRTLVSRLDPKFPAALCVVLHVGTQSSDLPNLLRQSGPLPARHAADGEPLVAGHILVAPPDHHLTIDGDHVHVSRGPKEHHTRPAVDPLFRSAALAFRSHAIGVVLTGRFDDGRAGVQAIRDCGGRVVVQDPAGADEPGMPLAAMRALVPDRCVPLDALAATLSDLLAHPAASAQEPPPDFWIHEHRAGSIAATLDDMTAIAQPSTFVCPDCGGALWEVETADEPRFRCHIGHAYSANTLNYAQRLATDVALGAAVRALHERELLLRRMAALDHRAGDADGARQMEQSAAAVAAQVKLLRELTESG